MDMCIHACVILEVETKPNVVRKPNYCTGMGVDIMCTWTYGMAVCVINALIYIHTLVHRCI